MENLELAELRRKKGLISLFDYRDIQLAYLSSGLALLQAKFNLMESNVSLLKLSGGIIQEFE